MMELMGLVRAWLWGATPPGLPLVPTTSSRYLPFKTTAPGGTPQCSGFSPGKAGSPPKPDKNCKKYISGLDFFAEWSNIIWCADI